MIDHHSTEASHHRDQQRQASSLSADLAKLAPVTFFGERCEYPALALGILSDMGTDQNVVTAEVPELRGELARAWG